MNTNTLTETDALAIAIASSMTSNWGKSEATAATRVATNLYVAGKIDAETLALVNGRLGNHSAIRQDLEKHALLKVQPSALTTAIRRELDKEKAALASLGEPSAPAKK